MKRGQISEPFHHSKTLSPSMRSTNRLEISFAYGIRISKSLINFRNHLNGERTLFKRVIERIYKGGDCTEQSFLSGLESSSINIFLVVFVELFEGLKNGLSHFLIVRDSSVGCRGLFLVAHFALDRVSFKVFLGVRFVGVFVHIKLGVEGIAAHKYKN
jgi:hypothetical protein